MFILGCIGNLCHFAVVDACYIFWGGFVFKPSFYLKFEYASFPIGR